MSVGPFVIEFLVIFVATIWILHQYGNIRKQHILVSLAVFVSWFFSFLIVFILPIDVSNTCYNECIKKNGSRSSVNCVKPISLMPNFVLPDLWRTIYWSSQILSWLLLPMMQSYVYAGAFSIWGKIKTALWENALWYGSYLIIFFGLLIYVAVNPKLDLDGDNLKLIGITASNTWGLLLLVLLIGYGLVELPRNAWNMSQPNLRLEQTYFRIAKLSTDKEDAEEELSECLTEVKKASEEIKYNSNLRKYIDIIIDKCPEGSSYLFSKGTDDFMDYTTSATAFNKKALVSLHKKVITLTHRAHRTQVQWNSELKLAFDLEDVERSKENPEKLYKYSFNTHAKKSILNMKMKWLWEISVKPWVFRGLAIILFCLSVMLVWSEMTFFSTNPVLSIYALMIKVTKKDQLYLPMEFVSCVTIAYMCACTYYTVFRMKIFNFYYFAPNHQTDSNSLLFSGLLLCRLTYALCLNFLAMIHLDGHVTGSSEGDNTTETYFTKFMGHMDLLAFIAKGLNVYYPMIVLVVCICTYFSIGKRILHCFGVEQFLSDDDFSADYVREGKEIARREKRKIERELSSGKSWSERSKTLQEKYLSSIQNKQSNERIDDSDDSMINGNAPKSNLNINNKNKYADLNPKNDKIPILGDVEYAPPDPPKRNVGGYEHITGTSKSKIPRNIFDDA